MKDFSGTTPYGLETVEPLDPQARQAIAEARHDRFYARFGKRLFDISLALLLLPMLVPVILAIWLLTRRDGGPGFYSQMRVGKDGRLFTCWKIRSMHVDSEQILTDLCARDPKIAAEWKTYQKLKVDPRITPLGRFIRATSLDELPQIWNVLAGDMSFIGPRPFMSSQEVMYRQAGGVAYYHMRPGITGLWQVMGRGETSFVERVDYDTRYWQDLSFRSDLKILYKTVQVVFKATGT
ncbi:sugar transferase [Pseudooceanicola sp. 200-1SW]|uniref:sugar transferase n=1 Tax=Pseudooceanicola sp. 200-1SW TaxID=3425949 RepID=UPI003D7F95F9